MFDQEFIKYLSTLGVGGAIAGIMFLVYRKDVKTFTDQWKGQSEMLMKVVTDNTAAVTSNTKTIEALHAREDKVQDWLEHLGVTSIRKGRRPEDN